ncbi:hypothetical protein [Caldalkalibacillus salinus]|nr:hypothetical protein [Caldalkalibacillus salinus]
MEGNRETVAKEDKRPVNIPFDSSERGVLVYSILGIRDKREMEA